MGKITILFCCLAVVTFLSIGASTAYSEEAKVVAKEVSGMIFSLDLKKPSIVITPETTDTGKTATKLNLDIVNTTVIKQGSETVLLDDLLIGEKVVVKYQINDKNQNIATEILVE